MAEGPECADAVVHESRLRAGLERTVPGFPAGCPAVCYSPQLGANKTYSLFNLWRRVLPLLLMEDSFVTRYDDGSSNARDGLV